MLSEPTMPEAVTPPPQEPALDARATPWRSIGEVMLCSGYPTQLLLGVVLQAAGVLPRTESGALSATFVFTLSLLDTVLLLGLITFLLQQRGERPKDVFLGNRPLITEVMVGVFSLPLVILLVAAASILIRLAAPQLHNVEQNPLQGMLGTQSGLLAFLFVVIVAGGFREELQRVFLLRRFDQDLGGARVGLVITSLAFGLGHTLQGWDAAVITALLGALWGSLSLTRRSAVASVVSHSLFNSGELVSAMFR